ncbi:MAG: fructose-bisphosphatase class III [Ruminococcus sp.]|nr:fructose-bisphosphatase class III [Ruminococcus sp.]
MIYAMSDLHGQYEKYKAMLEKIEFSDEDTLYVLGDVVDRGPEPIRLLKDMMERPNVFPIMGNHDFMALHILRTLAVEITEENYSSHLDSDFLQGLLEWQRNGGLVTIEQFKTLSQAERADLIDYISEFPYYEIAQTDESTFVMVHSGLGNFAPGKKLREYTIEELAFMRPPYDRRYFEDESIYIVSGHTPTLKITGKAEIYRSCGNICIDCGAFTEEGRLAGLCLDTMEEFYV